jgi:hypothetical protein
MKPVTGLKKWALALAAPLLLNGCFIMPGKFGSTLDLRKDGSFTFSYKGEVMFQSPDEMMKGKADVWSDDKAECYKDGDASAAGAAAAAAADAASGFADAAAGVATDDATNAMASEDDATSAVDEAVDNTRPCSKKEIAEQRADWEAQQKTKAAEKAKESAAFASMFGYAPGDEKAMAAFATKLSKYRGWKSVVNQGNGKFLVDYQISGRLDHDFIFPVLPEGDVVFPFVQIRGREAGKVFVNTPALLGGGLMAMAAKAKAFGAPDSNDAPDVTGIVDGSFTITTDGEILTNNSEDGAEKIPTGRALRWVINGDTKRIPEALILLN